MPQGNEATRRTTKTRDRVTAKLPDGQPEMFERLEMSLTEIVEDTWRERPRCRGRITAYRVVRGMRQMHREIGIRTGEKSCKRGEVTELDGDDDPKTRLRLGSSNPGPVVPDTVPDVPRSGQDFGDVDVATFDDVTSSGRAQGRLNWDVLPVPLKGVPIVVSRRRKRDKQELVRRAAPKTRPPPSKGRRCRRRRSAVVHETGVQTEACEHEGDRRPMNEPATWKSGVAHSVRARTTGPRPRQCEHTFRQATSALS